jgi:hypothetical protein
VAKGGTTSVPEPEVSIARSAASKLDLERHPRSAFFFSKSFFLEEKGKYKPEVEEDVDIGCKG